MEKECSLFEWCQSFWLNPEEAIKGISSSPDVQLKYLWELFVNLDDIPEDNLFPCWILLKKPEIVHYIPKSQVFKDRIFKLLVELLEVRNNKDTDKELPLRKSLQESNPIVLKWYLDNIVSEEASSLHSLNQSGCGFSGAVMLNDLKE